MIDSLCAGGAQRQLVELALGFQEKGIAVSFLTYHDIPFFSPVLERAGISVKNIEARNYFIRLLKLRKYIRTGKYNAVLSFLEAPNFICEIAGLPYRSWKLVVGERSADPKITKSFKLRTYRWFHLFADYIVANSYANLNLVYLACPILPLSKGKVIYNSINFDIWKPAVKQSPGSDPKIRLIIAARQTYLKNLNGLVEAVVLLEDKERNRLKIDWYGDRISEPYVDNSFPEALNKIKKYGLEHIFTFYPAKQNLTRIIQEADAIGIFSFLEGFPNTVCEGMACAKLIISSEVSDTPKFLSSDKNLLCNPSKPESIKNALSYMLNMTPGQLINTGKENEKIARENFEKDMIVSQYLALLG